MMTRLEVLKAEKEQIKSLHCLSFCLIDKCIEWYDKEIEVIEEHGAPNKDYGEKATDGVIQETMEEWINRCFGQQADDPYQTDMDDAWEQAKAQADGDLISRQAVLKINRMHHGQMPNHINHQIWEEINELPSVAIPNKVGHWKKISPADIYKCSECSQNVMTQDIDAYNFCHGCGCPMEIER